MQDDLTAKGARLRATLGRRPDGQRGLFALEDIEAEEKAIWVPESAVLSHKTTDPKLRKEIGLVLGGDHGTRKSKRERGITAMLIALTASYLLEKSKGSMSSFFIYIETLPEAPPLIHTFSPEERRIANMMQGFKDGEGESQYVQFQDGIDLTMEALKEAEHLWGGSPLPTREEVEESYFFVNSRMAYMSMIPLIDLVNASKPFYENARIVAPDQQPEVEMREEGDPEPPRGFSITASRPIKAGEEILINYNANDAIRMCCMYGYSMGFETWRGASRFSLSVPEHLQMLGFGSYASKGFQLGEGEFHCDTGFDERAEGCIRMAALQKDTDFVEAGKLGWFEKREPQTRYDKTQFKRFTELEHRAWLHMERQALEHLERWEKDIVPAVESLPDTRMSKMFKVQTDTELRLLRRCAEALHERNQVDREEVMAAKPVMPVDPMQQFLGNQDLGGKVKYGLPKYGKIHS